ncbi:UNVERIFIED_CONTAM: hypothetical protein H355_005179 [Colinus virginianus]|nr:hypothetical protein H355_005179 [Colinus virginianus]
MYVKGVVKKIEGQELEVDIDGKVEKVNVDKCLNANVGIDPVTVVDLAKLPHANEACALEVIRERYVRDQIYTYAGRLLIAMNPFKLIPGLYEPTTITKYQNADTSRGFPTEVPPHTYAVAQSAMDMLRITKENQSCIVSDFTLAVDDRRALGYLCICPFQRQNSSKHCVIHRNKVDVDIDVSHANKKFRSAREHCDFLRVAVKPAAVAAPEALRTLRNNNSSRFGRFIKLDVAAAGGIHGGIIANYMLELSRIEFQGQNERNYHIFYQMLKGLPPDDLQKCGMKKAEDYEFLNKTGCYEVDTVDDLKEFKEVREQLHLLFKPEEELDYFKCLSAVLMAGNIKYKNITAMGTDKAAQVVNEDDFAMIATLLGAPRDALNEAITVNVVEVRGTVIKSPLSAEQATIMIRSMAKELYSTLFDFIVSSVNRQIKFDEENRPWIGVRRFRLLLLLPFPLCVCLHPFPCRTNKEVMARV